MSLDTIYALSSAPGRAGVSVVRVSGPAAHDSFYKITHLQNFTPRAAVVCALIDPSSGEKIDRGLVIPFEGPNSFTGEDVVEYHIHGSPAVLDCLLAALSRFDHHRMAEPGEFTRRAFENGRMDLTEAEAVADLIHAQTEMQRRQALRQMEGGLSRLYEDWRARLIRAMAYIEAVIDFPDEEIPDSETAKAKPDLEKLLHEIDTHLNDAHRGEKLREGFHIAILGAPNAGKSSLLNALARRDVAIVSPLAGTTRDIVEAHLDLGGYPVTIADTAGLRENSELPNDPHGAIEGEGIRRALARAREADVKLLVFDGAQKTPDRQTWDLRDEKTIVAFTKSDLCKDVHDIASSADLKGLDVLKVSSVTGDGVDALLSTLTRKIKSLYAAKSDVPSLTRARHRESLEQCRMHLLSALNASLPELMAEDVRMAARNLGRITGRVDVEDLLDVIFRDFCIGK